MPRLKPNEYQCDLCDGVFEKGWSTEEAEEEARRDFPGLMEAPAEERGMICHDCYVKLLPTLPRNFSS